MQLLKLWRLGLVAREAFRQWRNKKKEDQMVSAEQISGIVRHILTTLGGVFVTQGVVSDGQLEAIAGGLAVVVGVAWSFWIKRKQA